MPAARKRHCPALATTIPAKTCGADRLSRIPCPPSCPFNPFAPEQYDEFGSIELQLIRKQQERFRRIAVRNNDPAEINAFLSARDDFSLFHAQFLAGWRNRNAAGQSFFDAWEADRWDGLNNDERVLANHFRHAHAAILEVRRIIDDQSTEVVDLLDPAGQPFVIVDRSIASRAGRFSVFFIFIYKAPLFVRSVGTMMSVPHFPQLDSIDTIRAIASQHGGPSSLSELRSWLEQHTPLVASTIFKAQDLRTRPTPGHLPPGSWAYQLTGTPEAVTAILSSHPDAQTDPISDAEIDDGYDDAFLVCTGENQPIGRLLAGPPGVIASCPPNSHAAMLRSWVDRTLGSTITPRPDPAAAAHPDVPPILLSSQAPIVTETHTVPQVTSTGDWLRQFSETQTTLFFSEANALLEGKTPEEAAALPHLRPILVRLCKQHISGIDHLRRSAGVDADANEILSRLGLTEIIFPPAPLGKRIDFSKNLPPASAEGNQQFPPSAIEALPPLTSADRRFFRKQKPPRQPFIDAESILAQLRDMKENLPTEDHIVGWFETEWDDLADLIEAACVDYPDEVYFMCRQVAARSAWILHPEDFPEDSADDRRFTFFLEEATTALQNVRSIHDEKELSNFVQTMPQPIVALAMIAVASPNPKNRKGTALSEPHARLAIPIIIAAISELCMLEPR